jgi:hypothetical protein
MNKLELYFQSRLSEIKKKTPRIFDEPFFKDRVVLTLLFFSGLLILSVWAMAIINFHINEFTVPVRYNSFLGVTQLGKSIALYQIPIIFTFCALVNLFLSRVIYKKDRLVGYILCGTNILIAIITVILIINFARIVGA